MNFRSITTYIICYVTPLPPPFKNPVVIFFTQDKTFLYCNGIYVRLKRRFVSYPLIRYKRQRLY